MIRGYPGTTRTRIVHLHSRSSTSTAYEYPSGWPEAQAYEYHTTSTSLIYTSTSGKIRLLPNLLVIATTNWGVRLYD
eukprot:scaffold534267_cov20-Prasinocladus_malaysianus.AAC.1